MPETANKVPYMYSRRHLPPESKPIGNNRLYDCYDFDYKEGELIVVKVGQKDPQAEITAAKVETIGEMLDRMPGKTPFEKVGIAVSNGVVDPNIHSGVMDLSQVPNSVVEAQETLKKARAQAAAMPKDLVASDQDFKKMLENLDYKKIGDFVKAAFEASNKTAAKPEGENK